MRTLCMGMQFVESARTVPISHNTVIIVTI